jgi:hypothetical protein
MLPEETADFLKRSWSNRSKSGKIDISFVCAYYVTYVSCEENNL